MILCHLTDDEHKKGIERRGFAESGPRDSQGHSWFWGCEESARREVRPYHRWLVMVDIPDDVAAQHEGRIDPEDPTSDRYLDTYFVPFDVVNQYQPFSFVAIDSPPLLGS